MSRSNRSGNDQALDWVFPLVGVVLAVALAWGFGWLQAREEYKREHTPTAYAEAAKKDAEQTCVGTDPSAVFKCVSEKTQTAYQTAHDEQDLSAQQRAATSALATTIFSFLALVLSGVGVWFVKRTLDATLEAVEDTGKATQAMERQNDLAENTAKRQLRAYVTIEDHAVVNFQIGLNTAHTCKVYNRGQTPAYEVMVWSRPIAVLTEEIDPSHAKIFKDGSFPQSRSVLGPGQWVEHANQNHGPLTEDSYASVSVGGVAIIWAGVVTYRDAFGKRHRTTFKYFVTGEGAALHSFLDMTACAKGNVAS